jgi:hypothetical protein
MTLSKASSTTETYAKRCQLFTPFHKSTSSLTAFHFRFDLTLAELVQIRVAPGVGCHLMTLVIGPFHNPVIFVNVVEVAFTPSSFK